MDLAPHRCAGMMEPTHPPRLLHKFVQQPNRPKWETELFSGQRNWQGSPPQSSLSKTAGGCWTQPLSHHSPW